METFRFQALDASGHTVSGVVQAQSARQARAQLRERGLLPSTLTRESATPREQRLFTHALPATELTQLTRQLATLLDSGLTVEQAFDALIEESAAPATQSVLSGVKHEIMAGHSLAASLAAHERSFPDFYRALAHAGEQAGALPRVLLQLADYLDAREQLRHKTGLALLYPVLVTLIAIAVVTGLLAYVVPQVVQVFQNSRQALPWLTRALIALSDFIRATWPYWLALLIGATAAQRLALRREGYRRWWHAGVLRLPAIGQMVRAVNTSRFASTLSILVGGGVPLLAALETSARTITNLAMRNGALAALEKVRQGSSLAPALSATHEFPPLLTHLIANGEASGKLAPMLERASRLQSQSLERRLAVFVTLLEPALILAMGGIVLLIVLAILLPIIEINQLLR